MFYRDLAFSMIDLAFGGFFPSLKVPPADLTSKVAIITGGNSGIGLHIARSIARQGATVYLACRNTSKAKEAASQITSENPLCKDRVHVLSIDMSLLSSVRDFAETVKKINLKIDLLFHNAGVVSPPAGKEFTSEGFPMLYTTNFLGSFFLTYLLEPCLTLDARVIFTASTSQYTGGFSSTFSLEAIKDRLEPGFHVPTMTLKESRSTPDSVAYSQTKCMQAAFAKLLQSHFDRLDKGSGLEARRVAHAFSPGFTKTPIFGNISATSLWEDPTFWILKAMTALATDVSQGGATAVWLAGTLEDEVVGVGHGGCYWLRMARRLSSADMMSPSTLERLWLRWEADCGIEWR